MKCMERGMKATFNLPLDPHMKWAFGNGIIRMNQFVWMHSFLDLIGT